MLKFFVGLPPLIDRHQNGFLAVNDITEAMELRNKLGQLMPSKKFEVFHGELSVIERKRIKDRMKSGEKDLFLITVNLLDEGVDFPSMSLYIDLNKNLTPRELLQRWGRIARIFPGKEGVEIVTLTDWHDLDYIGEQLELLEELGKPGRFKRKKQKQRRPPVDAPDLVPLSDETKQEELRQLIESVKEDFLRNKNKESPLQRIYKLAAKGQGFAQVVLSIFSTSEMCSVSLLRSSRASSSSAISSPLTLTRSQ